MIAIEQKYQKTINPILAHLIDVLKGKKQTQIRWLHSWRALEAPMVESWWNESLCEV